jgi:hypothetical protein
VLTQLSSGALFVAAGGSGGGGGGGGGARIGGSGPGNGRPGKGRIGGKPRSGPGSGRPGKASGAATGGGAPIGGADGLVQVDARTTGWGVGVIVTSTCAGVVAAVVVGVPCGAGAAAAAALTGAGPDAPDGGSAVNGEPADPAALGAVELEFAKPVGDGVACTWLTADSSVARAVPPTGCRALNTTAPQASKLATSPVGVRILRSNRNSPSS